MLMYFRSFWTGLFTLLAATSVLSQDTLSGVPTQRVGVIEGKPYAFRDDLGNWDGLSVQLWRRVAERAGLDYEWVALPPQTDPVAALQNGRADMILNAAATASKESELDFLPVYHNTELGIAKAAQSSMLKVVKGLFTLKFLWVVLSISGVLLVVGALIYLAERRQNEEQFGGDRSLAEGLGSGFWWSGVTLTTIGYGDKAPQTFTGRAIAMLWMLVGMAVSASLTATMVALLNNQSVISFPEDLEDYRVGVIAGSAAADFLDRNNDAYQTFQEPEAGLKAVRDRDIDLFIHDATTLRYLVNNNEGLSADIQTTQTKPKGIAIALPNNGALRERLGGEVLGVTETTRWRQTVNQFGGD